MKRRASTELVKFLETNSLLDVTRGNSETQPRGSHADRQQGSSSTHAG